MPNLVDKKYKWYLYDLGPIILELALDARERVATTIKGSPDYLFEDGRLLAFIEVLSIMQQQAEGFQIDLREVGLSGIDSESLLSSH